MNGFQKYLTAEDSLHKAILDYIKLQYPHALVAHPANEGKRTPFEQFKIKWLGVSPGIPDILVFTPGKEYAGLAIEVKAGKNKPTEYQNMWLLRLSACGWRAVCTNDFDNAKVIIDTYFKGQSLPIKRDPASFLRPQPVSAL